jgi:hypothetical protein
LALVATFAPLDTTSRKITVTNLCGSTIWPGMHTGAGTVPDQVTGWEAPSGDSVTFDVAEDWTAGRIWARTGCMNSKTDGSFQCLTGSCGAGAGGDMTWCVERCGTPSDR